MFWKDDNKYKTKRYYKNKNWRQENENTWKNASNTKKNQNKNCKKAIKI